MRDVMHRVDFCVVGGGLAGMAAAIAAARHGVRVALMQDRPVLGGNVSSEIRMWICGAHGTNNRETGIVEELELENRYRNPLRNYSIWDSVLYEKVRFEPNITMLLNCSCNSVEMDGDRIATIKGWQTTSETWHTVAADLFADCSGDSVLAPLTGAVYRVGREARAEFDEDIEPEQADRKTMGMSCLIQARETDRQQSFLPPAWANVYETCDDLPYRGHDILSTNFWWIELGGEQDSIHDTEAVRDELLKVAFGVWDHIKNRGDHGADNWTLEWVGFLPGKRESRRYEGDVIVTQNDVRTEGRFEDLVAYGGWTMDDHHPGGITWAGQPTIFHPAPSPFGIPYRALYSRNVANLFCAGRNISVTHAAMSATRVMATCATVGQAVGTAASIAVRDGLSPRDITVQRIDELQQTLMDDDCYLPWRRRQVPALSQRATLTASEGNPEPLRNGLDRPIGTEDNGWTAHLGAWAEYRFDGPTQVTGLRFTFDSDLNRPEKSTPANIPLDMPEIAPPATLVRAFRILAQGEPNEWREVARVDANHQRLVRLPVDVTTCAVRFIPEATWGAGEAHVFAWDVQGPDTGGYREP
ncbi:MAG: FAD-dependent oxidoreductase [Anaerolineae bacterium]|nr:FAD-dependent oxidoreductase [Anaerolineae bacterium]